MKSVFTDLGSIVSVSRKEVLVRASLWMLLFSIILAIGFVMLYRTEISKNIAIREAGAWDSINMTSQLIGNEMIDAVSDIGYLAKQNELKQLLNSSDSNAADRLGADYIAFLANKHVYDQVRFIDAGGMEVVRVNYNKGNPAIVPREHLQDKSSRYYFRDAMEMEHGQIYLSTFDLNIEQGRLELPYKPALRIATQVCDSSCTRTGLVVLNYSGYDLLESITAARADPGANVWLTNADGYWLKGPEDADEWGFALQANSTHTMANLYPQAWQHILASDEGQFFADGNLFTFTRIYPRELATSLRSSLVTVPDDYHWIVVSIVPKSVFRTDSLDEALRLLALCGLILLLLIPLSWLLARLPVRQKALTVSMTKLLDNVPVLICYVDSERCFRFNNKAYTTFFGFDRKKLSGCRIEKVLGKEGYAQVRPYMDRALDGELVSFQQRIPFRYAGTRTIAATYVPDRNDDGSVRGFFGVVNDITELDKARESERHRLLELAHAQRINSMGEMATEIAHEINQPLATIANFSTACEHTLRSGQHDNEQLLAWIMDIRDHAKRASEVVRRLRAFLKKQETEHEPTDINALIRDVIGWMQDEIRRYNIDLATDLQTDIPEVIADEILLQQVILNLMRNAIEALADVKDDPRRLEIHSHVDDSSVHVTVSDSGPGIPAGIEDQVFHPFITSKDDGLGIGLSVSRSIVEAHGGRLDIKWGSAPMTSFVLTLPLVGQQDHD